MTGRERGGPTQHEQLGASQTFSLSPKGFLREGQESPSGRRHDTPDLTVELLSYTRNLHNGRRAQKSTSYPECRADFVCPYQINHQSGPGRFLKQKRCSYSEACNQQRDRPAWW